MLDTEVIPSGITPTGIDSVNSSGTSSKVIPEEITSYETESEDERFDIIEPVIKDPPSIIQKKPSNRKHYR